MTGVLEKFVYGDKDLTLKEQADLADKLLDVYYGMMYDSFPDLQLTRTGSILYNSFEISTSDGVKVALLGRKKLDELSNSCSGCGRTYEDSLDHKKWALERMISDSKELLQKLKTDPRKLL